MHENIERTILLINKFINSYANFDNTSIEALITDEFEFKNVSQGEILEIATNKIEFLLILEQSKALFEKRDIKINSLNINKSIVEADILINAKMAISTPDGLKAGQNIQFKTNVFITFYNNYITKVSIIS